MQKAHKIDLKNIQSVFSRYPEVQAVYLYGSHASGRTHPQSDIDLAIYPDDPELKNQKLDILADLVRAGFENVHLAFVGPKSDPVFAFEVIHQNRIIHATDHFQRGTVYSRIVRQYFDFLPFLEVQRKAYKERVLHGSA